MLRLRSLICAAAAVVATPLIALPAQASDCVAGTVNTYTALGFSCSVGGLTFSQIQVSTTPTSAIVDVSGFDIYNLNGEFGLTLNYSFFAPRGGTLDLHWSMTVTAAPGLSIDDAFLQLVGNTGGTGQIGVSEVLSNGVVLSLNSAGNITATFAAVNPLGVTKDDFVFGGTTDASFATSSSITNAFSVTGVPAPVVGAGLPGLIAACGALVGLARRRRRQLI